MLILIRSGEPNPWPSVVQELYPSLFKSRYESRDGWSMSGYYAGFGL
jgi:hypothetical protein